MVRLIFGFVLIFGTLFVIFSAHIYLALFIIGCQVLVFRELVKVRYNAAKAKEVPLFRTIQWCWFGFAMFYTYGDSLYLWSEQHQQIDLLAFYVKYHYWFSFGLYSILFAVTVLHMKEGSYKYQMGQLTWTLLTICLCVLLCRRIFGLIFGGIIWFLLSISMVICNDTFAYFCGLAMGKKIFLNKDGTPILFLKLSPNKTWEGFIGGGLCTFIFAFYWPLVWVRFQWLVCPNDSVSLIPFQNNLSCELDAVFMPSSYQLPQLISSAVGFTSFTCLPVQLHSMFLALYASIFAPFGGFFASAIKRAYNKDDFASVIPGHGGLMDRLDCQFLMFLCTSIHLDTFVRSPKVTVAVVMKMISLLPIMDQQTVLHNLKHLLA
jgi:phosphatidate cytidylyltransferase